MGFSIFGIYFGTPPTVGTCGESLTWQISNKNKQLVIRGKGKMKNFDYINEGDMGESKADTPWFHSHKVIEEVVLPDGITSIGDYACYCFHNLKTIKIPNSVTSIGEDAFGFCGLSSIEISDDVTSIGRGAFYANKKLKTVKLPGSLKEILINAFSFCESLTSIKIPSSLTTVQEGKDGGVFYGCKNLKKIFYPAGMSPKLVKRLSDGNNAKFVSYDI